MSERQAPGPDASPVGEVRIPLRVLGPVRLAEGKPVTGQEATLLVLLALDANRVVPVASLVRWLFGDHTGHVDRVNPVPDLRVLVSRLRRRLLAAALPVQVDTQPVGYVLVTETAAVDALVFDALAAAASVTTAEPARALTLATAALELWRGEVAPGAALTTHPTVTRLDELRVATIERRFTAELELGRHRECLADLLAACRDQPFREGLWRLAMFALYRSGRQAEALAVFQEARAHLVGELGVSPGPQLVEAEELVLHHAVPDVPPPVLARAEVPAARATAPQTGGRSLPRYPNRFVARAGRREQLELALRADRLVTVVGPAGIGKTRLVVETLGAMGPDITEVAFCELSAVGDASAVAHLVASAVGAGAGDTPQIVDALAAAVGRRRLVLVLDTCEHVTEGVSALVGELVARCPSLRVVATSRTPLGVEGERSWAMSALDPATEGVQLFCERALRLDASFEPDEAERAAVAELCARLDGLPLAIELAAARVAALSPVELLEHLDQRFGLLQSPFGGGPVRHRSLAASIDWSYRLLTPAQQHVLDGLSVFAGPATLEAVQVVCRSDGVEGEGLLRALEGLVDQSMVVTRRVAGRTRYRLLDSIRDFAGRRLAESGRGDHHRRAHARLVADRLVEILPRTRGPGEAVAVADLDDLWSELRVAVHWATATGEVALAVELVAGLGPEAFFRERAEVGGWMDAVLDLSTTLDQDVAPQLLGGAALCDWTAARFERGQARALQARLLADERGAPWSAEVGLAHSLHRGVVEGVDGLIDECRDTAARLAVLGDRFGQQWSLTAQAMGHGYAGQTDQAVAVMAHAEDVGHQLRCPTLDALGRFTWSIVLLDTDPDAAVVAAEDALRGAGTVRAGWIERAAPNYLAAALVRGGEPDRALDHVAGTLALLGDGGSIQSTTNSVRNAVVLLDRLGAPEHAARLVGWLAAGPAGVPGTPGMREHVSGLVTRLPELVGPGRYARLRAQGMAMTRAEVVIEASRALAELR